MVMLERLNAYSSKLFVLAFFGMLIATASAPFAMGDTLPMTRLQVAIFFAATAGLSLAVYLGSKLVGYAREKRRKTSEANSITEVTRKRP